MDIAEKFDRRLRSSLSGRAYQDTHLPEVITKIVVKLMPIEGASLSLFSDDLRMPLAASDDQARTAETAQFTLGDGPCLETFRTGRAQTLEEGELAVRWPLYLAALVEGTTYRSVASVPVDLGSRLVGVLDLYLNDPAGLPTNALPEAHHLAAAAGNALNASPNAADDDPQGPVWLRNPATQQRATAWIAIGLVARAVDLTAGDALDVIRAYAWAHGSTVDDVSQWLASHSLTADQLLASP